jgi:osmotically-inducible protein OsmY
MSPAQRRDLKIINRIVMMVRAHRRLGSYESAIQISIENAVVLLHGELPTQELKNQLNSTIRQAGVLLRIDNAIEVLDA